MEIGAWSWSCAGADCDVDICDECMEGGAPAQGQRAVVRCCRGHGMSFERVQHANGGSLRCDGGCGRRLPAGALAYGCPACDLDVCVACANDGDSVHGVERGGRGEKRRGGAPDAVRRRVAPRGDGKGGEAESVRRRKAKRKRQDDPGHEPGQM